MIRFNSGEFRTPIIFYRVIEVVNDSDGQLQLKKEIVHKTKAKVKHIKASEILDTESFFIKTTIFYTRYIDLCKFDNTNTDNDIFIQIGRDVKGDEDIYNIIYINDIEERHRYLEIKALRKGEIKSGKFTN